MSSSSHNTSLFHSFGNSIIIILELHGHVKFFFIRNQEKIREKPLFPPFCFTYQTIFSSYTHFKSYPHFVDNLLITLFFFILPACHSWFFLDFFLCTTVFHQIIVMWITFYPQKLSTLSTIPSIHIIPKILQMTPDIFLPNIYAYFLHTTGPRI